MNVIEKDIINEINKWKIPSPEEDSHEDGYNDGLFKARMVIKDKLKDIDVIATFPNNEFIAIEPHTNECTFMLLTKNNELISRNTFTSEELMELLFLDN